MKKITDKIDSVLYGVLVLMMSLMVMVVTWQVFTRYVLGSSSAFTEELATFLLIWITLLGSAYAIRRKSHIGIDYVTRQLMGANQKRARYFVNISIILFASLALLTGGIRLIYITLLFNQTSAALQIPMGYIYMVLPLSGLLMIWYSVTAMVELKGGAEEEFITQSETTTFVE